MNILNIIGPKIDPCGTPEIINSNNLYVPLIRVDCCLSERYEQIYFSAVNSKPYACNLAIKRSCFHTFLQY